MADVVLEWEIKNVFESMSKKYSCICGKENIRYLYKIKNIKIGTELFPMGSSCIKKFNRTELNEITAINEKLFLLLHEIEKESYIELNSKFFSKNLLRYLYDEGAFENEYNNFNSYNDYKFMLTMFNKKIHLHINRHRK